MTSTILIDASSAPDPAAAKDSAPAPAAPRAPRRPGSGPQLTFGGVLRSERIKLLSLRSIRLTLVVTVLGAVGLSVLIAWMWSSEAGTPDGLVTLDPVGLQQYLLTVSTFTAPFLALVFGVLGVLAMTSEYSSGMILSTLAAVPKRMPVFTAKALVTAGIAAATALVLVVAGMLIGLAFLPEAAAQLVSTAVLSGAIGTVAYLVLIALLAFGIASMLRSTAGGISVIAGITFVLPVAMQVLSLTGWEWVPTAMAYLPSDLGATLAIGLGDTAGPGAGLGAAAPNYWSALLAMGVWAAAALVPAALSFRNRDAR